MLNLRHPNLNHRYLVALGSNLGDRSAQLRAAVSAVNSSIGPVLATAPFYVTEPIGAADQTFLNSAVTVASSLDPEAVLSELLHIETKLGRIRAERWGNRLIDLDVLLWQRLDTDGRWESASWASPTLSVPHPEMLKRAFVMIPAAVIAPDWIHPLSGRSLQQEVGNHEYSQLHSLSSTEQLLARELGIVTTAAH
ncbi:MAG: 2-amino-4-hydroxy-6-hydroxymethyldihydropteridine diphosphokinase [Proteobacteria bacterium]|nr:2-amino-4-hydroxy-6-hydroxymethyldihydropteridine diphosphokinase [Pseudomonadota bacterium]